MDGNPYVHDPKDVELENEISRHIHNLRLGSFRVSVRGGHVTLSGITDDFYTKRQIGEEVRSLLGGRELVNSIKVTRQ